MTIVESTKNNSLHFSFTTFKKSSENNNEDMFLHYTFQFTFWIIYISISNGYIPKIEIDNTFYLLTLASKLNGW